MGEQGLGANFFRLWTASTTSALGSGVATVAAPLFVATRTTDPLVVSGAFAVSWLPWLLFALPGGVLVDRVDRRKLMIVLDGFRVLAVGVLATAMALNLANVAFLYVVLFLINSGEVVFRSASQAMIPAVVVDGRLEKANGWLFGGTQLMQGMVAGPLGAFLFVIAAGLPFFLNAATYALSALMLALIAGTYRAQKTKARTFHGDIADGFRWLMRQRLLRTMAILIGLLNLTLTAATAMLVLLARQRLGLDAVGYGLLFTAVAAGGVLGSVLGDPLIRWLTPTWTLRIGLLVETATHLVLAAVPNAYAVGVILFAFGVHGSLWGIVASSLRQRLTPPEMLGRVGSTGLFIAAGGNCVGAMMGGVLASAFGITAPYWLGFFVAVAVTATTWRVFHPSVVSPAPATAPVSG
ncbi:MFS transporter [Labedaea rhizosphaerae]|uniref:Putative MFS family arabinose efflux permease n=1 Tax=Labedaea rhizosphaerae TaxID=598644 RepID=A0A4R6SDR3_LABRH|nr:MFS transporter [Labedaea rhizosphaerae]TDP97827.1 putative MFS family arabinose efflux permease [Labedaea rhizosphaerae]